MRSVVLCRQLPTAKQLKVLIVTDHQAHPPAGRLRVGEADRL
jgi:hypothetical protein